MKNDFDKTYRKRFEYIVEHCAKKLNVNIEWYDFLYQDCSEVRKDYFENYCFDFVVSYKSYKDCDVILEGGIWGIFTNGSEGGFPVRWFFENFEKELEEGIKKYNETN